MSVLRIDDLGAEWRASRAITVAAIRSRTSLGGNGLNAVFLALALVIPLLAGALSGHWLVSIGLGAGIPLSLLALMWWGLLLPSIARQNHAASILVPDFATRSQRLVALLFVLVATVLTALFACAGAPVLPTLVLVCSVMIFTATFVVLPRLAYLCCAALFMPGVVSWFAPGVPERWLSADRLTAIGAACCVAIGYALLRRMARGPWPVPGHGLVPGGMARGGRAAGGAYARMLRRDCVRGDAGVLLLHALGPAVRLERTWWIGAVVFSAMSVAAGAVGLFKATSFVLPMPAMMCFLLLLQAMLPYGLVLAFRQTRAEQSLLRLAPRMPGAAAMNTVLARALLGRLAACWAIINLLTLTSAFGLGASLTEVVRLLPACCLAMGASALAMRDYAADEGAPGAVLAACAVWLLPALALQYAALSGRFDNAIWWTLGAVTVLAGAVWARHCWLRMVKAPAAFPAGRL
ncbi:hypothetical protein INH39_17225 [Massilia violaceinigra]|uniref:Uncharacterized protein n=1 Tax=Massilia violaceinigra TaxID=2045208 RepID=A0ABY4A3M8_9BURK|nr:hypothetical protein [Massilia violaceinigra]UOD27278.1 hypothetical protein INH39_17225 [Massilia violaceinigra]